MTERNFILASASPRRKILLEKAGWRFTVVVSNVDESKFPTKSITAVEHTRMLALAKAKDVANRYKGELVMGADTVVDFQGRIIGKPENATHAEQITRMLFSQPHDVITSVALVRIADGTEIVETAITRFFPKQLTEEQIADHINNGKWKGKAGAYGIQETGDRFVERVEGSFTNVIGLPMELVEQMLAKLNE